MPLDTDHDWKRWGKTDPYYSVLSLPQYHRNVLDDSALEAFFGSGHKHVDHVLSVLRQHFRSDFKPSRALDYGCGVGRVAIPLARNSDHVIAIDVSPAMLEEAAQNASRRDVHNIEYLLAGQLSSVAPESIDLIHSFIVFQHIDNSRGLVILQDLLSKLKPGGLGAIHLIYERKAPVLRHLVAAIRRRSRTVHSIVNLLQGRSFSEPAIQMNTYSLNKVFGLLYAAGCGLVFSEFSHHSEFVGVMLYLEKTQPPVL